VIGCDLQAWLVEQTKSSAHMDADLMAKLEYARKVTHLCPVIGWIVPSVFCDWSIESLRALRLAGCVSSVPCDWLKNSVRVL
jgi:hypothetical protein